MTMGQRIKEQRSLKEWTQLQLAEKLEVSVDTIKSLEIGRAKPSVETLTKLSDLFDCTTDYLLGRTNLPNQIAIETWDEFHDYMETAARLIAYRDKARAMKLRESLKKYPAGDDKIPPDQEKHIAKLVATVLM